MINFVYKQNLSKKKQNNPLLKTAGCFVYFLSIFSFLLLQKNETLTNFEENTEISISECFQNESTKKEIESFIFNHTLQNKYSSFMLSNFYQMKYLSFEKGKKLQTYLTLKTPYPDYNFLLFS